MLRFDWDPDKAASNERKHGVSFSEAATAFGDPLSITVPDPDRFVLVGLTYSGRLVVVAHVEVTDAIRIISARSATRAEREIYEEE